MRAERVTTHRYSAKPAVYRLESFRTRRYIRLRSVKWERIRPRRAQEDITPNPGRFNEPKEAVDGGNTAQSSAGGGRSALSFRIDSPFISRRIESCTRRSRIESATVWSSKL